MQITILRGVVGVGGAAWEPGMVVESPEQFARQLCARGAAVPFDGAAAPVVVPQSRDPKVRKTR